mmetsp:Transcript_20484/g.61661  ORF Transcript_20484/g.61661 Transcript_20484/m.61661 type:complete len:263 (+) Transcript_20484:1194-1982(+)
MPRRVRISGISVARRSSSSSSSNSASPRATASVIAARSRARGANSATSNATSSEVPVRPSRPVGGLGASESGATSNTSSSRLPCTSSISSCNVATARVRVRIRISLSMSRSSAAMRARAGRPALRSRCSRALLASCRAFSSTSTCAFSSAMRLGCPSLVVGGNGMPSGRRRPPEPLPPPLRRTHTPRAYEALLRTPANKSCGGISRTFWTAPGRRLATEPATFSACSSLSMAALRWRSHASWPPLPPAAADAAASAASAFAT